MSRCNNERLPCRGSHAPYYCHLPRGHSGPHECLGRTWTDDDPPGVFWVEMNAKQLKRKRYRDRRRLRNREGEP